METPTNINVKMSSENEKKVSNKFLLSRYQLNRERQEKEDSNINIAITPGSSNPMIDIKFNRMEIKVRKRKQRKEPVGQREGKHARRSNR